MKLYEWLKKNHITDEAFGDQVGCDRVTINRLKRSVHMPSWPMMARIARVTKKQVMPNDFLQEYLAITKIES